MTTIHRLDLDYYDYQVVARMLLARASVVVALTTLMNDVGRQRLTSLQWGKKYIKVARWFGNNNIKWINGVLNAFVLIVKLP